MGAVYYGIHPRLNKEVAVKVLPFDMAERNPDAIQRFYREAQLAARVQSPHLVGVMDVNQESGLFFLVMEYVDGVSALGYLRKITQTGAMGLHEAVALDICIAACTGLAAAHAKGVIHRDVKPDNILIPRDEQTKDFHIQGAKLADLGLARSETLDQTTVTKSGACMGTPGYMSPEQASDAKICGKSSDVFSLGATLYALLSGHPPFTGSAMLNILNDTVNKPHEPIRNLRQELSLPTATLLDCCLAKDSAQRYVDAAAMLSALKVCRTALGEPQKTQQAVVAVSELLRAEEIGQEVPNTIAATTPVPVSAGAPKGRAKLWLAVLLIATAIGYATWVYLFTPTDLARKQNTPAEKNNGNARSAELELKSTDEKLAAEKQRQKELQDAAVKEAKQKKELEEQRTKDEAGKLAEDQRKEKERLATVRTEAKIAEAKQALGTNLPEAYKARDKGNWDEVLLLLKEPCETLSETEFVNKAVIDNLIKQAKNEINLRKDFEAKLEQARRYVLERKPSEASKAFQEARAIWPNAPNISEIVANEKLMQEALDSAEAERKARESEEKYQSALVEAKRVVALFQKQLAPQQDAEVAVNAVLALKPKDVEATALLAKLGPATQLALDLGGGVKLELVLIKPGTFLMGSPETEAGRGVHEKQHRVTISEAFYMGKFTVTQEQYEAVTGKNPSHFKGPKNPVEMVSWNAALEFCDKLNDRAKSMLPSGMKIQLPTEAQWEYACRAGTTTPFYTGETISTDQANYNGNSTYGNGVKGEFRGKTTPVGSFKPNGFGLYDMSGNVKQWCESEEEKEYNKDVIGRNDHVTRGGCWG